MSRRGWGLFVAISLIWGLPYLLIKVTVAELDPVDRRFPGDRFLCRLRLTVGRGSGPHQAECQHRGDEEEAGRADRASDMHGRHRDRRS